MTTADSLRAAVATLLDDLCAGSVTQQLHDTCVVLADACEEEGDGKAAEFWRLVAARKVWPRRSSPKSSRYEWWCWTQWLENFCADLQNTTQKHIVERHRKYIVPPSVFHRLPCKAKAPQPLEIGWFRSLSKAILSLELAWRGIQVSKRR